MYQLVHVGVRLQQKHINKISETYEAFVDGTLENIKGFCAVTDTAEIEKQR